MGRVGLNEFGKYERYCIVRVVLTVFFINFQHVFRFISQPATSSIYLFSTHPKEVFVFVPVHGEGQISPGQHSTSFVHSLYATLILQSLLPAKDKHRFSCRQGQRQAHPAVQNIAIPNPASRRFSIYFPHVRVRRGPRYAYCLFALCTCPVRHRAFREIAPG